jgi:hypothetical protein
MAIVVETGSGSATAESFASVADATTYHSNRGNAAWAALASDTVREQCLRKATDYMEQAFRTRWQGYRNTATQALSWPRSFVYLEPFILGAVGSYPYLVADDIVPVQVKNACAELALKAATADLLADTTQQVVSETIGPISTTYDKFSPQNTRYIAIEAMLQPYFARGSNSIKTVRA